MSENEVQSGPRREIERSDSEFTIPVIEERVEVSKGVRETGRVRIRKSVATEDRLIPVDLEEERVEIQRVPVNATVESVPLPRNEGDVLVLPVVEEILVIEKRILLKEEVRIRRVKTRLREDLPVAVRRENIDIENVSTNGSNDTE